MENKKVIFIFLAFSYSAQPYIAMHCNNVGKKFSYTTTIVALFLYIVVLKIAFSFLTPLLWMP